MIPTWYLCVAISILSFQSRSILGRAAGIVNHVSLRDGSLIQANLSIPIWPPCPFKVIIPKRKGNPYILVTRNDRLPHGPRARQLALTVCRQMTDWLLSLPQSTEIKQVHWEHSSHGEKYADEYSVWLSLDPTWPFGNLDREMAYFAMEEVKLLVETYGAMEGVFEFWMKKSRRAMGTFRVWKWPAEGNGTVVGGLRSVQR
ncbi:MAG: hypothetical protein L6R37_008235 [Teloschistes peruensis]|nr:MAG: hypothetical protein L6R37_008235 [Teloschistes peruensis]